MYIDIIVYTCMYVYIYIYICIHNYLIVYVTYIYIHMYKGFRGGNARSQNRCFLKVHDKGMGTSLCCPTRAMVDVSVGREKQALGSGVPW